MFRKNKKEYKAKLEHKLYLARETPEPIFDLSECDLRAVPSGIYSLCKVFLKETLNLQHNCITSLSGGGSLKDLCLLKILDVSHNAFTSLPNDIDELTQLQELYINDNQIKQLPYSLCNLKDLQILDASNNLLKRLPENIGELTRLQELNLKNNKHLKELPKSMSQLQCIKNIEVDSDNIVYPPTEVIEKGTESIMKYICKDVGCLYTAPDKLKVLERSDSSKSFTRSPSSSIKRKKMEEFLEMERQREMLHRQEFELACAVKADREKLLSDITEQQIQLDRKLTQLQQEKEYDKFRLIEQLQEEEEKANVAVNQLLSFSREPLTKLLEEEKLEERRIIEAANKQYDNLEKTKILADMQEILHQENEKFKKFGEYRSEMTRSILAQEIQSERHLLEILNDQGLQKAEVVSKLEEDMLLQKAAVGALLERSDARSWGLLQEVQLVESQLAALTAIELDRQKLKMNETLYDLAEKRENLSHLLVKLFEEQNIRRKELLSTLNNAEEFNDNTEDFWLKQYQRLLERMPNCLSETQKNIDPKLSHKLLIAGVIQYLPILMAFIQDEEKLINITERDILEAGVSNTDDCYKIYKELKSYVNTEILKPSAPPLEEEASAPLLTVQQEARLKECVVCMDNERETIFIPCGHYCCCTICSNTLVECPLCRMEINQKVNVFHS